MHSFSVDDVYGVGMMELLSQEFRRTAIELCENLCGSGRQSYHVWLVPIMSDAFHFIYDPRSAEVERHELVDAVGS